jgi:hypothetical protein
LFFRPSKQIVAGVHDAPTKFSKWRPATFDAPSRERHGTDAQPRSGLAGV